jgi:hypothetical protein
MDTSLFSFHIDMKLVRCFVRQDEDFCNLIFCLVKVSTNHTRSCAKILRDTSFRGRHLFMRRS